MKALVQKEIRMLLPAFGTALMLVVLPDLLAPTRMNLGVYNQWLSMFGIMMLGVSVFGREIGLKTFPFILTQPLERLRIWRTKISVLGICIALVFFASWATTIHSKLASAAWSSEPDAIEVFAWSVLVVIALTTGGVWMTLLVRQMAAAFWLAYLIPAAIGVSIRAMGGANWIVCVALCIYSCAAFYLARWQFLHMQDTGWTGGALTLGNSRTVDASASAREREPWRTLLRKELKLHTITLAGIAALFVVHLGVIAIRKAGAHTLTGMTLLALQSFGLVWVVVPFVAGSQSVAEERQNGTLDGLLCLPVSRRAQFGIKLAFVVVLGGLLSAVLLCGAEAIGKDLGAGTGGVVGNAFEFVHIVTAFLVLSLVGFYASTLTRSVAQALAAGVVLGAAYLTTADLANQPDTIDAFGPRLWPTIANPALVFAIVLLSYGNFKWTFEAGRRWRRNIFTLATVVIVASVSATTVYHRAWGLWERFIPLEGAHGPAIIPPGKPVTLHSSSAWNGIAVLLPDGRLWSGNVGGGWNSGGNFATGSNWVDVALLANETVAIQSNGTLWVSEKPGTARLVQFGAETDWQSVVQFNFYTVALLKRDGTLWTWGPKELTPISFMLHQRERFWGLGTNTYRGEYPGLRAFFMPVRYRPESDWARIIKGQQGIYAWKQNGDAWAFRLPTFQDTNWSTARLPALDRLQFKPSGTQEVWIRNDGTLWWHRLWTLNLWGTPSKTKPSLPELVQLSEGTNWVAAALRTELLALKTDGSIWEWKNDTGQDIDKLLPLPLKRYGTYSDWVGLGNWNGQAAAVTADGSLWLWPRDDIREVNADEWLAPVNRPAKIATILAGNEHH